MNTSARWANLLFHERARQRLYGHRWYVLVDAADFHRCYGCQGVCDVRDLPGAPPTQMIARHALANARPLAKSQLGRYRVRALVPYLRQLLREARAMELQA